MNRWRVQNNDYEWAAGKDPRLDRTGQDSHPWEAITYRPQYKLRTFATHAEAITYADKQARRTA